MQPQLTLIFQQWHKLGVLPEYRLHTSIAAHTYYGLSTGTHHLPFELKGPSPAGSLQLLYECSQMVQTSGDQGHARDTRDSIKNSITTKNSYFYKHVAPGVFMYLNLRNEDSSLIVASLLPCGLNKNLLLSHRPSWSLQSDVTLIDTGLNALRVPIKQGLMLLLCWFWPHRLCV